MNNGEIPWAEDLEPSVALFSALAHPLRLAIVRHIMDEPHTVSEIHTCMGVSQPLVSHHLKILREASVITSRQEGRKTYYALADDHISHIVKDVYQHTKE
ncbi:metalloregulator ArsR/SmtB family transcription factor [Rothia sp. SD9660Na]|uniref:ArsR/SmtB family transcription factor n=1 Tax=Rothia sp. SD9660Na TaxID=3047030 RepID=UPI0024B9CBBD|nr:metalloregulator ArsR/SmtB family transcription factor [Rothia sp. SD9660Na]WHS51430.1 metalloregulator ArsR/SmtB family transcription factor [Rothia sp. SD9660Na]